MRKLRTILLAATVVTIAALVAGCGHKEGDGHAHAHSDKAEGDGHGHEEEAPSGASFKPGTGVILTDETHKLLGIEVADVTERKLPIQIRFNVQIFGEKHHHPVVEQDHSGCDVYGSGLVSSNAVRAAKSGQPVQLFKGTNVFAAGTIIGVQKALALGETEIVVGVSNATALFKEGEFVNAVITVPRDESVSVVPRSALLRTADGTFVYVVNGRAFLRRPIKVNSEADGWAEVTDGFLSGDQVVTKRVESLWLIELRATKGGGHAH